MEKLAKLIEKRYGFLPCIYKEKGGRYHVSFWEVSYHFYLGKTIKESIKKFKEGDY